MTFGGKKYDTSSKLNKTPPIGAPNATATPAAEAALRISRLFPGNQGLHNLSQDIKASSVATERTFVCLILDKKPTDDVADATCDVNKRSLLA